MKILHLDEHNGFLIACESPKSRTIKYRVWDTDEFIRRFISLPDVIFLIKYYSRYSNSKKKNFYKSDDVFVFFTKSVLKKYTKTKLKYCPLPNIGLDGVVCMDALNWIESPLDLAKYVSSIFWQSAFDEEEEDNYCEIRRSLGLSDDLEKWEKKTRKNPNFIKRVKWIKINETPTIKDLINQMEN